MLAVVGAAGCSVPRLDYTRSIEAVKRALAKAESALAGNEWDEALREVETTLQLADKLNESLFMGDPRRAKVDAVADRARAIRAEVKERTSASASDQLLHRADLDAKRAHSEAAASTQEVAGPPAGGELPPVTADAGGAEDAGLVGRDRAGDVAPLPEEKAPAEADGLGRVAVTAETEPVVIQKVNSQGEAHYAYIVVVNNTPNGFRIGQITGEFYDADGTQVGEIDFRFTAKGFKPNWDDPALSTGDTLTMDGVSVPGEDQVQFVVLGRKARKKTATEVRLKVMTTRGQEFRGKGGGK